MQVRLLPPELEDVSGRNGVLVNSGETSSVSNSLLIRSGVGPLGTSRCSNTALESSGGSLANLTTTITVTNTVLIIFS